MTKAFYDLHSVALEGGPHLASRMYRIFRDNVWSDGQYVQ